MKFYGINKKNEVKIVFDNRRDVDTAMALGYGLAIVSGDHPSIDEEKINVARIQSYRRS